VAREKREGLPKISGGEGGEQSRSGKKRMATSSRIEAGRVGSERGILVPRRISGRRGMFPLLARQGGNGVGLSA